MQLLLIIEINGWIIFAVVCILLIISFNVISKINKQQGVIREKDLILQRNDAEAALIINNKAVEQFEIFKANEIEGLKKIISAAEAEKADADLKRWIINYEQLIRDDAKKRSTSILLGKITEHLIPYSSHFSHFNPKDARFIGSPVDLIYFDGAADNKSEVTIWFVEVKTGKSGLTATEKKIKSAVLNRNVKWLESSLKDLSADLES